MKYLLALLLVTAFGLTGCKKEADQAVPPPPIPEEMPMDSDHMHDSAGEGMPTEEAMPAEGEQPAGN